MEKADGGNSPEGKIQSSLGKVLEYLGRNYFGNHRVCLHSNIFKHVGGQMIQILEMSNKITIRDPVLIPEKIKQTFTILNPEFAAVMKFKRLQKKDWPKGGFYLMKQKIDNRWTTKKIPQNIYYFEEDNENILVPRSALFWLKKLYAREGIKYLIKTRKRKSIPQKIQFTGSLQKEKGQLIIQDFKWKNGIIQAPTGSGKTVMALYLAGKFNVKTCIVVDTGELQNQWVDRVKQFTNQKEVGMIGGGVIQVKPISVALMQTLRDLPEVINEFDLLIIDECHIAATESYGKIVDVFDGQYIIGLSATPVRRDGKTMVMHWYLGPTRTKVEYKDAERTPAEVKIIPTTFVSEFSFRTQYTKALAELTNDDKRNQIIAHEIIQNINHPGLHLILSRFTGHLYNILEIFPEHLKMLSRVLIGSIDKKSRKEIVQEASKGKLKFLFATEALLGKGFDEPLLSVLHLTTPIKYPPFLTQCIGRITRVNPGKEKALIFDYWDSKERIIGNTIKTRIETYDKLKIRRVK